MVFRALCTGTGPLGSRHGPHFSVHACGVMDRHLVVTLCQNHNHQQPPQPPHSRLHSSVARVVASVQTLADAMCGERDVGGVGSARRRRERLLRSMLRHEWQTVAMELAAALHHSCGPGPDGTHTALRGPKTASSGRVLGARSPRPQLVDAVLLHRAAPLLAPPLAAAPDDDGMAFGFLEEMALLTPEQVERIRKVERERKGKEEEKDEKEAKLRVPNMKA